MASGSASRGEPMSAVVVSAEGLSTSSRYGVSPASPPDRLDGRRPRPRRGGRRLSLMPLFGEKVNRVLIARSRCGLLLCYSRVASSRRNTRDLRSSESLSDEAPSDERRFMTGIIASRRVLCCRYRWGADAARDSNDAGATARHSTSGPGRSVSERPRNPDVLAGGTTSRSCRRTPRVSRLVQFGATLGSRLSAGFRSCPVAIPRAANFVPGP